MPGTTGLFKRFYYDRASFVDGTTEFHRLCSERIGSGKQILEIGAGPPNQTSVFLSSLGFLKGIDVSDEVLRNSALQEAKVFDGNHIPYDACSFDACVSNYVMEHVENPDAHFREVARVLKPGGVYLFRTPNLWHYVSLAARALPHFAHLALANRLRDLPEDAHDPWTTFYRANTRQTVTRLAHDVGLQVDVIRMVEKEPFYARSSAVLFFPLMAYERVVNSGRFGEPFRANMQVALRKRA
jgi:SAM-dependent methyltransferase